jgi:hypothetical protein
MRSRRLSYTVSMLFLLSTGWLQAQSVAEVRSSDTPGTLLTPAATNYLAFVQQPTAATGGDTISPAITVQLKDKSGTNLPQSGVSVVITLSTGTGVLSGTTTRTTNASGLATFGDLTISLIGTKRLTAAATNFISAISNSFSITLGPPATLRIQTEPSATATAGVAFAQQPIVYIEDAGGNRVTTDSSTVVTASRLMGEGTLQGILTATAKGGIATFSSLAHNVADTITILFGNVKLKQDTSRSIIVSPAAVARLAFLQQPSTATAGVVISPAVTVALTDAFGNRVRTTGTSITVALYSGTGVLSGTLTRTTTSGIATFANLSINLSGSKTLRATSGTLTAAVSNAFTISPGPARKLVIIQQPTNAVAAVAISPAVTVRIRDSLGNNVPTSGLAIALSLTSGTGTLSGTTSRATDTSGLATFSDLSVNLAGKKIITASSALLASAVSDTFTIAAGAAAQLAFVHQPTGAKAGVVISPAVTVQLKDAQGNTVRTSGVSTSITLSTGTGSLTGTLSQLTDATGLATFSNLSINLSGTKKLSALSAGLTASVSDSFVITAATASKLSFTTGPGGGSAGTPFAIQPVVTLEDAYGNPVPGVAQTVTLAIQNNAGPGGTLLGTKSQAINLTTGRAAFTNITIDKSGTGYTLTVTGSTVSTTPGTVISAPFQVTAGRAAKVRVENAADGSGTTLANQNITSGTSITVYAVTRDVYDNFVTNIGASTWALTSITGGVVPTDLVPGPDRRSATFTGRMTGTAVISTTSDTLTAVPTGILTIVNAGTASQIRIESAANGTGTPITARTITSGSGLSVYAIGRDAAGNFISNLAADAWSLQNKTGGVVDGDLVASADKKAATFTGKLLGTAQVRATKGSLATTNSGVLAVVAGAAATIVATGGTPQSTHFGTSFPARLVASVKDVAGNPAKGILVTWTAPSSGPSGTFAVGGSAVVTDSNGVAASGVFTANIVAGTYAVAASLPMGVATASYALTNTYGVAANIGTAAGSPQSARVTQQFPHAFEASITDSSGNAVGNITVTFAAPATGPTGTFTGGNRTATAVTGTSGIAAAPAFFANTQVGSYQVVATTAGVASSTAFELTNIAGTPGIVTAFTGTPQTTVVGSTFPANLIALVTDSSGNRLPGTLVRFVAPSTGPGGRFLKGPVDSVLTDGTGKATASALTANTVVGSFTVTAELPGLAATASFQLSSQPGGVDTFLIDASGGGSIGTQTATVPFNVRIRANDEYGNVATGFSGSADVSSNGPLSQAGSSTAPFASGVLASHTVALQHAGRFILRATRSGGAEAGVSDSFNVVNPAPTVTRLSPASGRRGQSLTVSVSGSGFVPGVTSVSFGDNITTSTAVSSATEMLVAVTIDTAAVAGARAIYVFNGPPAGGVGSLSGAFTVGNNPPPRLTRISPDSGGVLKRMIMVFQGTNFFDDATRLNMGPGISVNAITIDSISQLTADICIMGTVAGGTRYVSLINTPPGGGISDSLAFRITAPSTPYPILLAPAEAAMEADTVVTFRWHAWMNSGMQYHLQISTSQAFDVLLVDDSTVTDTSKKVVALARGITHYWRVAARNSIGSTAPSPAKSFIISTYVYPTTLIVHDSLWFPKHTRAADYQLNEYRLFGLPGNCNIPIRNFLTGANAVDWVAYWDNGAEKDYLVPFDGTATFSYSPGRAFWILNKGPLSIHTVIQTLALDSSRSVAIPLHPNWNLITNPFDVAVSWSSVQNTNGGGPVPEIWEFNGTFETATEFKPRSGYLYDNSANRSAILIPLGLPAARRPCIADPTLWRLRIQLSSGGTIDRAASIGVSAIAEEGRDPLDLRMPRGPGQAPGVFFERSQFEAGGGIFATDIRPEFDNIQTWPLSVRAVSQVPAVLSFSGAADVPSRFQVLLIDDTHGRSFDLRKNAACAFTPVTPISPFRVVVGTAEAVQSILNDLVPKAFALRQNFPNPFNPTTVISCQLPEASSLRLVIYDMLGREVAVLMDERKEPGIYTVTFDAKGLASGIYFCRMVAGGFTAVKKMVLMR